MAELNAEPTDSDAQRLIDEKLAMMQQGTQLGGLASAQFHWSAANQIRHAAFSSAIDIHRHRTTNHEQIIESAKAFETYLNGD